MNLRKSTFFLTLALLLPMLINAKERAVTDAFQLAGKFLIESNQTTMMKAPSVSSKLSIAYTSTLESSTTTNGKPLYYVFNVGESRGFIIVSADDRAKAILGYSDNGSFDITNIPENLRYWLDNYAQELKQLVLIPDENSKTSDKVELTTELIPKKSKSAINAVPPLLGNIKWDQGAPFNNFCPVINTPNTGDRAAVGCVATAMAQVMKYYNWPVTGTGSNSYTTSTLGISLSANFGATTYDWANMTDAYSASSTQIQKDAVATLMYHCGVATNMDYNTTSGTSSTSAGIALKTYFGYDPNIQQYYRDYYTRSEWINMLKSELDAARPVLYTGVSASAGHMFVCDGYDENGLFHFNWGWSGIGNGYFEITALNPEDVGIGGGNGEGFNTNQSIFRNLSKPNPSSTSSYVFYMDENMTPSASSVNRNNTFSITLNKTYNYGLSNFSGSIGLGLYSSDGQTLEQVLSQNSVNVNIEYGWTTLPFNNLTIPTSVAVGNYRIYAITKSSNEANWQKIRGKVATPNYLNVDITSSNINFSTPTGILPSLTRNSFSVTGSLYQNRSGRFNVSITNNGGEYNSNILIYLSGPATQFVVVSPQNIATGQTVNLELSGLVTVAPGSYSLSVLYDPDNNPETTSYNYLGTALSVSVLTTPTGAPVLSLTQTISFPNNNNVPKNNAVLNASVSNTGTYFEGIVVAFVFPVGGGSSLTYLGYQNIIIENGSTKNITFSGNIDLDPGQYLIGVYYYDSGWKRFDPVGNNLITFTLTEASPSPSVVTTQNVTNLASTTVTANGNLISLGLPNATDYGHCWSTQPNPTINNSKASKGNATVTGAFTSELTGLTPNTTYYLKSYATNQMGTSYGQEVTFTTVALYNVTNEQSVQGVTSGSDVIVYNGGHFNVNQTSTLNNIWVKPGGKLTLTNGNTLNANRVYIESDETGTGTYVDENLSEIPPVVSGTVEQYLAAGRNWYITTPVSNCDTFALSTAQYIRYYYEPTANWLKPATNMLTPLLGYISVATTSTGKVSFDGQFNSGSKSITLTRTPLVASSGFNLVGNPYPSYLDWDKVSAANTDLLTTMWYRTKTSAGAYTFDTYNSSGPISTNNGVTLVTNLIPPMQAYWVRVKEGKSTASYSVNNTMRSHIDDTQNKFKINKATSINRSIIRINVSNGVNSDQAVIYSHPAASANFDEYDSPKMMNNNRAVPEIYTVAGKEKVVINGLSEIALNTEIPIGFIAREAGNFSINLSETSGIDKAINIILIDKVANTQTILTTNDVYEFSSGIIDSSDRFSLILKANSITTGLNEQDTQNVMYVHSSEKNNITVHYKGDLNNDSQLCIFDISGRKIIEENLTSNIRTYTVAASGIYLVSLKNKANDIRVAVNVK